MAKKIIQDVIPPTDRRTIRNIKLSNRDQSEAIPQKAQVEPTKQSFFNETKPKPEISLNVQTESYSDKNEDSSHNKVLTIPTVHSNKWPTYAYRIALAGGVVVAIGFVYVLYIFLNIGAVVTLTPKNKEVYVKSTFTAKKSPKADDLPFEVISLDSTGTKTVPATGERKVEKRAQGKIVIYNDYSTQSQRLIRNTRLQSPDGLTFRLDSSIVVPGQTKKDGKLIPGSIEVAVSADTAGEEYNIGLTDFVIPGFKGDPRYDKFYGRSKTPMTGGFKGTVKTASSKDLDLAKSELIANLKISLITKAKEQTPSGYILYDNAIYVTNEMESSQNENDVNVKSSLHAIVFNKDILASFIAKQTLPTYQKEALTSETLNSLDFKPDSLEIAPWETGNLPFSLSGTTTLLWLVDTDKIKSDLAGIAKNQVDSVFKRYLGIEAAKVTLRPIWKSTLPSDTQKIEVIINK